MEKVVLSNAIARTMLSALHLMENASARQVRIKLAPIDDNQMNQYFLKVLLVTNARIIVQQEPMDKIVHNVVIVKM